MYRFLLLGLIAALPAAAQPPVDYPADYRQWTHVKSMLIEAGHPLHAAFGGIHHLYANQHAMQGYTGGGTFPDGSIIVFDLLEAERANNAVSEGSRKVLGVMQKQARTYAATGGWGFEGFAGGDPDQPVVGDNAAAACFGCHTARKESDHVFSSWRD